ncbi:MAG: hypothetical protein ACOY9J_04415 [Pseudomonadota bacterium]
MKPSTFYMRIFSFLFFIFATLSAAAEKAVHDHASLAAPAGVMAGHSLPAGSWMLGYRWIGSFADGIARGEDSISLAEVTAAGFDDAAIHMDMQMSMLELMYAPTDRLTLMLMPQYMRMDMTMAALPAGTPQRSHDHEGLGDTQLALLWRLAQHDGHVFRLGIGASAPTGDAARKSDGRYLHYGMQNGSGIWEAMPSLTWNWQAATWAAGAQLAGRWHLEEKNEAGFRFGDTQTATGWISRTVASSTQLSLRLAWQTQGQVEGHYSGAHHHHSPPDFQKNYGGRVWSGGIGVNTTLAGLHIAGEYQVPLQEDWNGIQNSLTETVAVSVSRGF